MRGTEATESTSRFSQRAGAYWLRSSQPEQSSMLTDELVKGGF